MISSSPAHSKTCDYCEGLGKIQVHLTHLSYCQAIKYPSDKCGGSGRLNL